MVVGDGGPLAGGSREAESAYSAALDMAAPPSSTSTPHLARLGAWVAGLAIADVPPHVLAAARYQILDMIAAAHAAARSEEARSIAAGLARAARPRPPPRHPPPAQGGPPPPALANAAYSMAQDFDDVVWMGHTCHSAVFASLAVAEHEGAGAHALLAAVVAANEIGGRIGASSLLGPLNGQMWTFIHLAGAAAATSKLLGLDAERTTHALAIALGHPNFALQPAFLAPTSKLLAAATPTAAGIQAAYFARAGMTGDARVLEDRRGFWRRFSFLPLPFMLEGLGSFWTLATLTLKTYPGCHYFQTACTAIEAIARRRGRLEPARVRSVLVETTKLGAEASRFAGEYGASEGIAPVNVAFDLRLTAAVLLHAGRLGPDEVAPAWLAESTPAILDLAGRIEVRHDPALTLRVLRCMRRVAAGRAALAVLRPLDLARLSRRYADEYGSRLFTAAEIAGWAKALAGAATHHERPAAAGAAWGVPLEFPNRVTVELDDGTREIEQVDLPAGYVALPGIEAELEKKLVAAVGPVLGEEKARATLRAGLELGGAGIEELVRCATPDLDDRPRRRAREAEGDHG